MSSEKVTRQISPAASPGGTKAPQFELPGTDGSSWRLLRLSEYTTRGVVALAFYPSNSLSDADPLSWLELTEGVDVLIVTNERCGAFQSPTPFPNQSFSLLCDPEEEVADRYGVDYGDPASCRLFLIDSSNEIQETWPVDSDLSEVYTRTRAQLDFTPTMVRGDN